MPADDHVVGLARGDELFADIVLGRRRQGRCRIHHAGLVHARTRALRAILDPVGDDEHQRRKAMALQYRVRVDPVVEIAVVEGEQHRLVGDCGAREKIGELAGTEGPVAGIVQTTHLVGKVRRADGDQSR